MKAKKITTKANGNSTYELTEKVKFLEAKLQNQEILFERLTFYNSELEKLLNEGRKSTGEHGEVKKVKSESYAAAKKLIALNTKLSESEEKFRQANAAKDKFIAIIAHDLLNPLQSLLLSTELLAKGIYKGDIEKIMAECTDINGIVRQIADLLRNLLQWAQSQSGRIPMNPEFLDISELIDDVIHLFEPSFKKKNIQITCDIKSNLFPYADLRIVNTVLRNLLSNALKFTSVGGRIKLSAKSTKGYVEISVCDNGVGIPEEVIPKLFRIDVHHTTLGTFEEKGTGLGLILCKEFVEKSGGKIWVESKSGKGSTFTFSLPEKEFDKKNGFKKSNKAISN